MAKRELIGDSEEVRAAIADLRDKVDTQDYPEETWREEDIAVKNFSDRITDTVRLDEVADALAEQEESLRQQREMDAALFRRCAAVWKKAVTLNLIAKILEQ